MRTIASGGTTPTEHAGLIAYFATNPVAAKLLMLFLILGGVMSGLHLAVRSFPDFDTRTVSVSVRSPGSSPKEIEKDINRRLEESLVGLRGVERVVSTASEGLARIEVEITSFADPDSVLVDVRNAVDSIERFPPINAEEAEVELWQPTPEVLTLVVSSPQVTENALRSTAEDLRDTLLELPSVSHVILESTRDREITIEMSDEELRRHRLSIAEVVAAVRRASLNLTFGELRTESGGVVMHTVSKRHWGEEFEDIPLITRIDGTILRLGQVARIRDGFADQDIVSKFNGEPAVLVRVSASEEESFLDIARDIEMRLADYRLPAGITVEVWNNQATPILSRMSSVARNGIIGIALVFICLILVFDLRVATWITVGIPLSFVGSLLFFGAADLTLNMATMFAFFLLIGVVVDDAVVVGDSIAAERERGSDALDAAIRGARTMVGPITIGVLTTILAFVPLLFVTEGYYQVVNVFPWVALFVLLVSLVEAFFILPAHLSRAKKWSAWPLGRIQERVQSRLNLLRDDIVLPAASWAIRHIGLTILCAVAVVIASLALLRSEQVRIVFFDRDLNAPTSIQADLYLPVGAPFETTLSVAERFAEAATAVNGKLPGTSISAVSVLAGNLASPRHADRRDHASHLASVRVHLNERPARSASPVEIERAWRHAAGEVYGLERIEFRTTQRRSLPNVAYAVKHEDEETLRRATEELLSKMEAVPGIYGVSDNLPLGKRHFEISLTPAGEAAGLTPAGIGTQLRASFHGVEVQRIQRGRDEVRVMVRYPVERRKSLAELAGQRIQRAGGGELALSEVAEITERRELATLMRIDGKRSAQVYGNADAAVLTPIQARQKVQNEVLPGLLAKYPGLRVEPEGAARSERALLETLGLTLPIVLFAMYALMAAFLRSYWKPLVAVVGIPISFAGAVLSHWVLGWDFTAMSLFGVIGVAGVVVNDALVLLHRYNAIRTDNPAIPAIAAATAAARDRFRPVFLTSLTTVLGLSPMLYDRSDELIILVPLVVSMLGGLALSTLFVLFLLPTLVMIAEGRRE